MTQDENFHPCPQKKIKRKKKFPIKARKETKEKENFQSKIGRKQKKKSPIKGWKKAKKKEKNIQEGLWTRQYLNNTKLSQANKKRKETTTGSGPLPLITNQNLVHRQIFRLALNKNRKGKGQNTQSQIPHQNTIPKKVLLIHDHACNL